MGRLNIILVFIFLLSKSAFGQNIAIQDANLIAYLKTDYPALLDNQDKLIVSNAQALNGALSCTGCGISDVDIIQYFENIQSINFSKNNIKQLPELSGLGRLEVLNLSGNVIELLPEVSSLTSLRVLNVNDNKLSVLPELSSLVTLIELSANKNQLSTLPELGSLNKLVKIDVGGNKLQDLPNLSSCILIEQLICYDNQLINFPSIKKLAKLQVINLSNNNFSNVPDFTLNTALKEVYLDNNNLTSIIDFTNNTQLTSVILENNYLTFKDLNSYTKVLNYKSIFSVSPQKSFSKRDTVLIENSNYTLNTGLENQPSGTLYEWFKNDQSLGKQNSDDFLLSNVDSKSDGNYKSTVTNPSWPDLQLILLPFKVKITPCIDTSNINITTKEMDCMSAGGVQVTLPKQYSGTVNYKLTSQSGQEYFSQTGSFKGLFESSYKLELSSVNNCVKALASPINLKMEECEEVLITPNGDGENDDYYINFNGNARFYNKSGVLIYDMKVPGYWNASTNSGKAEPGYYVIDINEGKDFLKITVVY